MIGLHLLRQFHDLNGWGALGIIILAFLACFAISGVWLNIKWAISRLINHLVNKHKLAKQSN